jgi:hypothetical protein
MSTAPWDQPRKSTTVTVDVPNPMEASDAELLAALNSQQPHEPPVMEQAVEYVNSRRPNFQAPGGQVCFCVSWRNRSWKGRDGMNQVQIGRRLQERIDRGRREHGDSFDPRILLAAPQLHAAYERQDRVEIDMRGDGEEVLRGRLGTTTGWRPCWLLIRRVDSVGSTAVPDHRSVIRKVVPR